MSKFEIPSDILDIIFFYKKQLDLKNIMDEIKTSKKTCMNCNKDKNCLYNCKKCNHFVCYGCRYNDLNEGFVDKNTFDLFYNCDKCDLRDFDYDTGFDSSDYYDAHDDYYNNHINCFGSW